MIKKSYLQLHLSIFLWGFTGILGRLIEMREGLLVCYRLLITSVLLFFFLKASDRLHKFSFREHWKMIVVGCLVASHWLFFYGAIKYSNVSVTLSCLASTALFTSLFEPFFNRKKNGGIKINPLEIIFALMALAGIYLVFAFQKIYGLGILLAIIASCLAAIFTVFNKRLMVEHQAETVSFFEIVSGLAFTLCLLPFYLMVFPTEKLLPSGSDWMYLFFLSFFCTVIPFILSLRALKNLSAFTVNLSINLEPVYGIILAFIVYKENKLLGPGFYAGTGLIMLSVLLHSLIKVLKKKATLK